jgi:flagellar basal-body rod protein FlgG
MVSGKYSALSGAITREQTIANISNNLANVSTNAYKKSRAVFEDLLYQNVRQVGGQTSQDTILPSGLHLGTGSKVVATEKIHTQGNISNTENSLDVAIDGKGYFPVLLPDGQVAFTRDGSFKVSDQGQMVTASGYTLQPGITIPANSQQISIASDGTVSVSQQGVTAPVEVGNIQISNFINPTGLQPIGENLYVESGASGAPQAGTPGLTGLGHLRQGALETSNVNIVEEMVSMIETQRAYEMKSKLVAAADGMMQFLNNNV